MVRLYARTISSAWKHPSVRQTIDEGKNFLAVVFIVAMVVYVAIFAFNMQAHNDTAEMRERFNASFWVDPESLSAETPLMRSMRQVKAREVVEAMSMIDALQSEGVGVVYSENIVTYYDEIKQMAETGDPAPKSTGRMRWDTFVNQVTGPVLWLIVYFVFSGLLLLFYVLVVSENNGMVADLPWRKPSSWIWLGITLLPPVGPGIYAVSYFRVRRARIRETYTEIPYLQEELAEFARLQDAVVARAQTLANPADDPLTVRVKDSVSIIRAPQPSADIESAFAESRSNFIEFMREAQTTQLRSRLNEVSQRLKRSKQHMKDLAVELQSAQAEWRANNAVHQELDRAISAREGCSELDLDALAAEFDSFRNLEGVMGIRVVNDVLHVYVRVIREYAGKLYDFGDWELCFDPAWPLHLRTDKMRNAYVNMNAGANYGNGNNFCFGNIAEVIRENLENAQVLQAMAVAIRGLRNVNEGAEHLIPLTFRRAVYVD